MGRNYKEIVLLFSLIFIVSTGLVAQEEIKVKITEGISMVPVALPNFAYSDKSIIEDKVMSLLYETVWNDLEYSKVFKLVPRQYFSYIKKIDHDNIIFKDWESVQARVLITGKLEISKGDRIIFSVKVYEVKTGKIIFKRNFGARKEFTRLIAHRVSDEMMKHFGEKPYFTSKLVYVSTRDGNKEIYIMDYDGGREKRITFNTYIDLMPSWSKNSENLMFTTYKNGIPDLVKFNLYSGKTSLISTGGVNYRADWSNEGGKLVYTSSKKGKNAEIYVRKMDSGKEKRLTFNRIIDSSPCWSPNGREIAFTSQRSGTPQIYIMNEDGTNVRRITYEGTYHDNAAWSPDGSRIAYVSRIEGRFDIYVLNIKKNSISKLTEMSGRNENPTWSPDSRHIVFTSNRNGRYQIYSIDYDGQDLKKLTRKGENLMPKWQKAK